jgi:hypothetical protein
MGGVKHGGSSAIDGADMRGSSPVWNGYATQPCLSEPSDAKGPRTDLRIWKSQMHQDPHKPWLHGSMAGLTPRSARCFWRGSHPLHTSAPLSTHQPAAFDTDANHLHLLYSQTPRTRITYDHCKSTNLQADGHPAPLTRPPKSPRSRSRNKQI